MTRVDTVAIVILALVLTAAIWRAATREPRTPEQQAVRADQKPEPEVTRAEPKPTYTATVKTTPSGPTRPAQRYLRRFVNMGDKTREKVQEVRDRLQSLRKRCEAAGKLEYRSDPDVAWLTRNRIPAAYVLCEELGRRQDPLYTEVILYTLAMIGWRPSSWHIAPLLDRSVKEPPRIRFYACWALGVIGGAHARTVLKDVLQNPEPWDDRTLVVCCRGLANADDAEYLPLLRATRDRLSDREARLRIGGFILQLGDDSGKTALIEAVTDKSVSDALRADLMDILAQHPGPELVAPLAQVARTESGTLGEHALGVLMSVVFFGDERLTDGPLVAPAPEDKEAGPADAREQALQAVLAWWHEHREKIVALQGRRRLPVPAEWEGKDAGDLRIPEADENALPPDEEREPATAAPKGP